MTQAEAAAGAGDADVGPLERHRSTVAQARKTEVRTRGLVAVLKRQDGPNNFLNGQPLSAGYFNILQKRRELPVHAQR